MFVGIDEMNFLEYNIQCNFSLYKVKQLIKILRPFDYTSFAVSGKVGIP